jgi:hypothetical protein
VVASLFAPPLLFLGAVMGGGDSANANAQSLYSYVDMYTVDTRKHAVDV